MTTQSISNIYGYHNPSLLIGSRLLKLCKLVTPNQSFSRCFFPSLLLATQESMFGSVATHVSSVSHEISIRFGTKDASLLVVVPSVQLRLINQKLYVA
mmetsp:Transcript_380/g.915  ORF Transcript_380/g.915 Transcript_380/m.915 type:complete len:98 (-) Transcript_380:70-363(-)